MLKCFWPLLKLKVLFLIYTIIGRPRQGYGTTTTGRCAKIALENFKTTSEILNIDPSLIEKLNQLVKLLYSQEPIDLEIFQALTKQIKND